MLYSYESPIGIFLMATSLDGTHPDMRDTLFICMQNEPDINALIHKNIKTRMYLISGVPCLDPEGIDEQMTEAFFKFITSEN
jgi:hypothetical protein